MNDSKKRGAPTGAPEDQNGLQDKTKGACNTCPLQCPVIPHSRRAVLLEFTPDVKGTWQGFASVEFPSGMLVRRIAIHEIAGDFQAKPPRPIRFVSWADEKRWSDVVIDAMRRARKEASETGLQAALRAKYPHLFPEGDA